MGTMTAATTPKGERRRSRLIAAAGELLLEGGFDAVRHRAVADRAQLPLASTTYYFGSLEDLMAEAAAFVESVNGGNRVVPTALYSDGTTATNPPASQVRAKLAELAGA